MSREAKIRATAAALQPKGLDLTQFARARVGNTQGYSPPAIRLRADDAAWAIAFAAARGDVLSNVMLRLKYAEQRSEELYKRAQALLLNRYGGLFRKKTLIGSAVAMAAIYEWVHDRCPNCRDRREVLQPRPCPSCKPTTPKHAMGYEKPLGRRDTTEVLTKEGRREERSIASASPAPGCTKCHGLGRVFDEADRARGVKCIRCRSSGRIFYESRKRHMIVSALYSSAQKEAGRPITGIKPKAFADGWGARYCRFVDALRMIDRHYVAANLDFGWKPTTMSPIELSPQENQYIGEDEPARQDSGCPTADEPAALRGSAPPEES